MSEFDQVDGAIAEAIASASRLMVRADGPTDALLRLDLAALACTLANARLALAAARQRLADEEQETQRLRRAFARHDDTVDHHGMRYRRTASGRPCGKPFCQRCDEVEGRLILTLQLTGDCSEVFCPACKTRYPHVQTFLDEDEIDDADRSTPARAPTT